MKIPIHIRLVFPFLSFVSLLFAQNAPGQFGGVGIFVEGQNDGTKFIRSILPGGPAEGAGITAGDELLSVNGRSVASVDPGQVANLIRGPVGSDVTLTIRTTGHGLRDVVMKRALLSNSGQASPPAALPKSGSFPGTATPADKAPNATQKFSRLSVRDPGMNNIEAVSLLIPDGWKVDGGVQWFHDYSILANLLLRITEPQTGAQIEFLPLQNFIWLTQMVVPMQPGTNYLGNILAQPITDIPAFVRWFYGPQAVRALQNAKQVSIENLPKLASEAERQQPGCTARSARVRYEYTINGQLWEDDVFVTLTFVPWQMGTLWSTTSAYSFRALKGQLDRIRPAMSATVSSLRLSQDWFSGFMYVQSLFAERVKQGIRNAKALSETVARNSDEIRRMYADSYRQRSESQDRISQSFSEHIRGVETYRNPFENRPVQLPSGYNDAWVNGRGEYILSNNANYNPNVGDNTEWRRMAPK